MNNDISDLNYYFFNKESNLLYNKKKYKVSYFLVLKKLFKVFTKGIASLVYFFDFRYYNFCHKTDFALFSFAKHNKPVILPLNEVLPSSYIFSEENIKFKKVWFYAMLYSPIVLYRCIIYKGYKKETYCFNFESFCKAYGMFVEAKKILKIVKPKMVVVVNNQSYTSRSFYKAAKNIGIKTVFLQHASAVESDPKLDFDYAFLDGLEAYEKLTAKNLSTSTVFLSGNPRFDYLPQTEIDKGKKLPTLGLAINLLDVEKHIKEFVINCRNKIPELNIVLRPHPTTNLVYWQQKCIEWGCVFSDSRTENPFDFIDRCSLFVAGNSSFHLDVAISDKRSFYYNFTSEKSLDLYSYIQNNLISDITGSPYDILKNALSDDLVLYKNPSVSYYVANYNTIYWRRSTKLIVQTLLNITNETDISGNWNRQDNFYTLKE